jgi:hypothetical protein
MHDKEAGGEGCHSWSKLPPKAACLLQRLGLEEELSKLSIIHVAGTKGKGSTSSLVESMLRQCGYKTGLYTSPHLIDIRERIRINGYEQALGGAAIAEGALGGMNRLLVVPPLERELWGMSCVVLEYECGKGRQHNAHRLLPSLREESPSNLPTQIQRTYSPGSATYVCILAQHALPPLSDAGCACLQLLTQPPRNLCRVPVDKATFLENMWWCFNTLKDKCDEEVGMPAYFRFLTLLGGSCPSGHVQFCMLPAQPVPCSLRLASCFGKAVIQTVGARRTPPSV